MWAFAGLGEGAGLSLNETDSLATRSRRGSYRPHRAADNPPVLLTDRRVYSPAPPVRRRPPTLRPLCLFAVALSACASSPATTTEHIGGRLRERPYASATAYEAFLRGELAAARGDFAEADRQMNLASFADESDPWIVARRVQHLTSAGQRARAVELARAATARYAGSSAAWLSLATALGDDVATLAERDAALARAVGLDPGDAEVRATAVRIASRHTSTDATPARVLPPADPVERLTQSGQWSRAAALVAAHGGCDQGARLALAVTRVCAGDTAGALVAVGALSRSRGAIDRTSVAWLWLRAGEVRRALDESALALTDGVAGAAAVRAAALAEADRVTEALRAAALVSIDDRAPALAPATASSWEGRCAPSGSIGRAEGTPRGSALALVTPTVAAALDRAGRRELGDVLIERAMTRLQALGADGVAARDALRQRAAARLDRLGRAGEATAALAAVEGVEGRLARAASGAWDGSAAQVEGDLAAAAASPQTASRAAAWRVLWCARPTAHCAAPERTAAEDVVRASADEAPVAAMARALLGRDVDAVARVAELDGRSPWRAWVAGQIAPASGAP